MDFIQYFNPYSWYKVFKYIKNPDEEEVKYDKEDKELNDEFIKIVREVNEMPPDVKEDAIREIRKSWHKNMKKVEPIDKEKLRCDLNRELPGLDL